jgi:AraC-like DNA-binding protein
MAVTESFKDTFWYKFFVLFVAITTFSYLSFGLKLIRRHQHNIQRYFSNLEKVDLHWLRYLILSTLFVFIITMGVIVLDLIFHFIDFKKFESGAFVIASIFVLLLGFTGIRQTTIFSFNPASDIQVGKNEDQLYQRLMYLMKNKKPYLDPDISIEKLSNMLRVNENELSGLLNRRLHQNFFEFINLYRIETFKEQVLNPSNERYTIISIAFECGFNSKATFNRVFKNFTNLTPVEYKRKYQKTETS